METAGVHMYEVFSQKEIDMYTTASLSATQRTAMIEHKKADIDTLVQNWTSKMDVHDLPPGCINIVLLGAVGAGKSKFGNLLLGEEKFKSGNSNEPVTKFCVVEQCKYKDTVVNIMDLPGIMLEDNSEAKANEYKSIVRSAMTKIDGNGIHVFVFVVNGVNYRSIKAIETSLEKCNVLNTENMKHCIMVISHGDSLPDGTTLKGHMEENYCDKTSDKFQEFLKVHVSNYMMIINSTSSPYQKQCQRTAFFNLVASRHYNNNYEYYSKHQISEKLKDSCFPASSFVKSLHGPRRMEDLKLGDEVLTLNGYEKVIMFSHADPTAYTKFLALTTEGNKTLQLSPCHLLHVNTIGNLRAARDVQIGDVVFSVNSSEEEAQPVKVEEITEVWNDGIYCPHTPSGNIIAGDLAASCYTNIMPPTLAHILMLPARVFYRLLPADWFKWLFPYDQANGWPVLLGRFRKHLL